jgi:hypothetical protein
VRTDSSETVIHALGADADQEAVEALLTGDPDAPFYVVTLSRTSDPNGEAIEWQAPPVGDGAEVVFVAPVERQLQGEPAWERIEVVGYPNLASFTDTVTSEAYAVRDRSGAEWQVMVTSPVTPITEEPLLAGEEPPPLPIPADVPFPATEDDSAFTLVAAVNVADNADYEDGRDTDLTGEQALDEHYQQASGPGGGADLGIRPVMWMDVQLTLVGDPDAVESIRFNYWPSHATLFSIVQSTGGLGGPTTENRTAGLDNAWTMIVIPEVDAFTPELQRIHPALLTEPAVEYLRAADAFQACFEAAGYSWVGEPTDTGGEADDGDYVLILFQCETETQVRVKLESFLAEEPGAPGNVEIEDELLTNTAVAFVVSVDAFRVCLADAGTGWQGDPRGAEPSTPAGDAAYDETFGRCTIESGIGLHLSTLLTD